MTQTTEQALRAALELLRKKAETGINAQFVWRIANQALASPAQPATNNETALAPDAPGDDRNRPDAVSSPEHIHERGGYYRAMLAAAQPKPQQADGCYKLDTPQRVFFYEQDFYVLSNFSAFRLLWNDIDFDTSEHAYHCEKFDYESKVFYEIRHAQSAHEAFKLAEHYKHRRRSDWDDVRVGIMRGILRAKADQHEYVRRKLLATGDRELIEDSWRDDFWGWGQNRDGQNMLGKLWMEVRAELRAAASQPASAPTGEGEKS